MENLPTWVREDFRRQGLHNVINARKVEVARFFLEQGGKLDGTTVLKVAQSKRRSVEMFELFVDYGWDVNTLGCGGDTVLTYVSVKTNSWDE